MALEPGLRSELVTVVEHSDTATRVGSGDVPVLATPRLLALVEGTCARAAADRLDAGATTVGSRVELEHLAPTPIGRRITVQVELTEVAGRRLAFAFTATDAAGTLIGRGTHDRVVVDRERFLAACI